MANEWDPTAHLDEDGYPRSKGEAVEAALEVAERYGGIDGGHHKTWVIDQMVRALLGKGYADWVRHVKAGEDGPETYSWNEGIAP